MAVLAVICAFAQTGIALSIRNMFQGGATADNNKDANWRTTDAAIKARDEYFKEHNHAAYDRGIRPKSKPR